MPWVMLNREGYVEADESLDLDGLDAAAKLVILANWIMGMKVVHCLTLKELVLEK